MCMCEAGLSNQFCLSDLSFTSAHNGMHCKTTHCMTILLLHDYYMRTEAPVMLAHHFVSTFGLSYVLYSGRYGCDITATLWASEFTNPLLQLRWFLKNTGNYFGSKAVILDWTFVTLFVCVRLGLGTAFVFAFLSSPDVDWVAAVGGSGFYLISVVFGVQILFFVYRKYFMSSAGNG